MADEKDANTQGQPEGEGEVSFSDAWKEAAAEEKSVSEDHSDPLAEPSKQDEGQGQEPETPPAGTAEGNPPAAKESQDDIWANADPKLREAFEAERSKAVKTEQQLRTQDGRLSSAMRQLNQLKQQLAPKRDAEGAAMIAAIAADPAYGDVSVVDGVGKAVQPRHDRGERHRSIGPAVGLAQGG